MKTRQMSTAILVALMTTCAATNAAAPRPLPAESSVAIDVEDLDLASHEIAARVYARIASAAARLCRDASAPWDGSRVNSVRRCTSAAVDAAVKQANAPALTAVHESEKGRRGDYAALTR